MHNLLKLQKKFIAHIFDKKNSEIFDSLNCKENQVEERLNIYRNNIFGNYEFVLNSIYPQVRKILKDKEFFQISHQYIKKFPSKSGNLDDYGFHFPKFLKNHKISYLSELAKAELMLHQAYFEDSSTTTFDVNKFKKIATEDYENLQFSTQKFLKFLKSNYNIAELFQDELHHNKVFCNDEINNYGTVAKPDFSLRIFSSEICEKASLVDLGALEQILITQKLSKKRFLGQSHYIIYKTDIARVLELDEEEVIFLKLILKKKKLYEIFQILKETDVGKILKKFIENQVIVEWKL